jgi:hypothetical protein
MPLWQNVVMNPATTMTQPYPPSGIAETEYGASSGISSGFCAADTGWCTEGGCVDLFSAVEDGGPKVESSMCSSVMVVVDMLNTCVAQARKCEL